MIIGATIIALGALAYLVFLKTAKPGETSTLLRTSASLKDDFKGQHLTASFDAYHAYVQGRYYASKETTPALEQAIQQFQEALRNDPKYALPYVGLAEAYASLGSHYDNNELSPGDAISKARAAAAKALELNDSAAETHVALGVVKQRYDWDWHGAEREFKRAIELLILCREPGKIIPWTCRLCDQAQLLMVYAETPDVRRSSTASGSNSGRRTVVMWRDTD